VIQRLLGAAVGALVAFIFLWFSHLDATAWAIAVVAGAITSFFWPIIVGWYLARRGRRRREDEVQSEVARQMAQQNPPR